ncbi:hypothetical protein HYALB_00009219 [Hymenoscyphus albidus]|uniref:Uncharacterized protein n=1 Tax=Hymenoscyphus albidus TaxID=595503 RepID=A0A9N9LAF6_9HELO|nr:hypothetical protein HYALB_00009219 [Hymenoscyphus albidus]
MTPNLVQHLTLHTHTYKILRELKQLINQHLQQHQAFSHSDPSTSFRMEPPLNEAFESTTDPLADLPQYIHPFRKEFNGLQDFIENFQQRKVEMEDHHCPLSKLKDFVQLNIVGIQQQIVNLIHMMSPFSFMRLPLEIRGIYSYFLPESENTWSQFTSKFPTYPRELAKDALSLLCTKQIHNEVLVILPFKGNMNLRNFITKAPCEVYGWYGEIWKGFYLLFSQHPFFTSKVYTLE